MAKRQILNKVYGVTGSSITFEKMTVGVVVDTDDPQQMGRVRAVCLALNDTFENDIQNIPWASYVAPFGGTFQNGTRGPGNDSAVGSVAYGMWNVPKVGAQVLIACIDGNPLFRVWLGCLYETFTPHTMPHGRYTYRLTNKPEGPLSSSESPIQPLYDNYTKAFGDRLTNYEWRTRGADHSLAAVDKGTLDEVLPTLSDDKNTTFVEGDGHTINSKQGYRNTRLGQQSEATEQIFKNKKDSHVYSWTTPGFHSISMDDSQDGCRIRIRTTSGHQIIMDDTNERMYISTAQGNSWIELDQNGNIDVYSARNISLHAEYDINFTAGKSIRLFANEGIHAYSGTDIVMHAINNAEIRAEGSLLAHAFQDMRLESDGSTDVKAGSSMRISANSTVDFFAASRMAIGAASSLDIKAGGNLIATASQIHFNGPTAANAESAQSAGEQPAKWTNRVPSHEPFARTMTISDYSHDPQFSYDDPKVGRVEGEETIERGPFWHR